MAGMGASCRSDAPNETELGICSTRHPPSHIAKDGAPRDFAGDLPCDTITPVGHPGFWAVVGQEKCRGSPLLQTERAYKEAVLDDLEQDERWQLIERILATGPFQKSVRLPDLLRYMAERSIHGHPKDLTEHRIGSAVFGKPASYSPTEDSSVRVHVRQLRLKLHEYFDSEGRNSEIVVEIPKGAYTPLFRTVKSEKPEILQPVIVPAPVKPTVWRSNLIPWAVAGVMALVALFFWHRSSAAGGSAASAPWPLSEVLDQDEITHAVIADSNYGMLRILSEKSGSLEEYLSPQYRENFMPSQVSPRESRMVTYLSGSSLTSYADVVVVNALSGMSGGYRDRITVRSARDLRFRDMQDGNYILVGSPSSNPWVSLYESRLNFVEGEGIAGQSMKFFQNKHPGPGEQPTYRGLEFTGTTGVDYATISLLPTQSGRGNVLILQGLQQEGTEAAGLLLADSKGRSRLEKALGVSGDTTKPIYFEALIKATAVGGAPDATEVVATRIIQP